MDVILWLLLIVSTFRFAIEMLDKGKFKYPFLHYLLRLGSSLLSCFLLKTILLNYVDYFLGMNDYKAFLGSTTLQDSIVVIQFVSILLYLTASSLKSCIYRFFYWVIVRLHKRIKLFQNCD